MKIKKLILKTLSIGILSTLIFLIVSFLWLTDFSWTNISSKKEMKENGSIIALTTPLPKRFYHVYDIIHPDQRAITMLEQIRTYILPNQQVGHWDCKCDEIGYLAWNNHKADLKFNLTNILKKGGYLKFGIGLEKYSSPEKCFDFWINNSIFWKGHFLKDLNSLSQIIANKNVNQLNTEETILLIAWHDMLNRGLTDSNSVQQRFQMLKKHYLLMSKKHVEP